MRVPVPLINYFKTDFEPLLTRFLLERDMIPDKNALHNKRFLNRSVAPHVETLSQLFNRIEKESQTDGIDTETYWSGAGSPKNRRLAYFLSFMPGNIFRVASVWAELQRLGFQWSRHFKPNVGGTSAEFRAIEWGAGTAAGACGIIVAEKFTPLGLPRSGSFALIEQSKSALQLGTDWFQQFSDGLEMGMQSRPFHRRVDLSEPWLPKTAPKFHLFVMSYFLNESEISPATLARKCLEACEQHLEDEGLVVLVEPALKLQSRKLLEFRRELIEILESGKDKSGMKVLLPCLGHQACGALAKPEDWCHEEVQWWRPEYLRELDAIVKLDRKTLPFSYLVLQKTHKTLTEILPALQGPSEERYRLVSPSRALGKKDLEFYICGQDGKRRARYRLTAQDQELDDIDRGDILQNTVLHGEPQLTQIDKTNPVRDSESDAE
ncbi:MAG: hypothetical protein JST80_11300 [Bdellovibrionales bacterium]|nr:hypothetical protein [Bdellovibrionales bacterium]